MAGGAGYTNLRSALRLIARDRAEWAGSAIRITHRYAVAAQITGERKLLEKYAEIKYYAKYPWRREDDDRLVAGRKRGQLPWNGADQQEGAFHLPFTSPVYPRVRQRIPVRNDMIP